VVKYSFAADPAAPAPVRLVLTVDNPRNPLPPASYAFDVAGSTGEVAIPVTLQDDGAYVIRASAASEDGLVSATVQQPLPAKGA
jgi:hypothetical protein